jgi:hypothetical protein
VRTAYRQFLPPSALQYDMPRHMSVSYDICLWNLNTWPAPDTQSHLLKTGFDIDRNYTAPWKPKLIYPHFPTSPGQGAQNVALIILVRIGIEIIEELNETAHLQFGPGISFS